MFTPKTGRTPVESPRTPGTRVNSLKALVSELRHDKTKQREMLDMKYREVPCLRSENDRFKSYLAELSNDSGHPDSSLNKEDEEGLRNSLRRITRDRIQNGKIAKRKRLGLIQTLPPEELKVSENPILNNFSVHKYSASSSSSYLEHLE